MIEKGGNRNRRAELIARVAAKPDHRALETVDPLDITLGDEPGKLVYGVGFGPHGVGAEVFGREHHVNESGAPDRRANPKGGQE
jgi:hypothetical protein